MKRESEAGFRKLVGSQNAMGLAGWRKLALLEELPDQDGWVSGKEPTISAYDWEQERN